MKLADPRSAALAAALALGTLLSPALAQDTQAPPAPASPPQTTAPSQTAPLPILPTRGRGDCASKAKNLTS